MRHAVALGLAAAVLVLPATFVAPAGAAIEFETVRSITLDGDPLDTALSSDGRHFVVLLKGGKVQVFGGDGSPEDSLQVAETVASLEISPDGTQLFLLDAGKKKVEIVELSYMAQIDLSGSPVKGPADAPVTIVEYSDFQCPYCSRTVPLVEEVLKKNPQTVKVVFKQFPLVRIHQFAMPAALASMAAGKQGKFWEYHDKLFANSSKLNEEQLTAIATELGLDLDQFQKDRNDPTIRQIVNRDMQEAARNNVRGTPTLFINGRLLKNRSVEGIQQEIDKELKRLGKQGK
ncbi:MAG: thioredoxin domain-containing protein [Thermodesulfobacteriota bacterium]